LQPIANDSYKVINWGLLARIDGFQLAGGSQSRRSLKAVVQFQI
jgi:hypothetical protein